MDTNTSTPSTTSQPPQSQTFHNLFNNNNSDEQQQQQSDRFNSQWRNELLSQITASQQRSEYQQQPGTSSYGSNPSGILLKRCLGGELTQEENQILLRNRLSSLVASSSDLESAIGGIPADSTSPPPHHPPPPYASTSQGLHSLDEDGHNRLLTSLGEESPCGSDSDKALSIALASKNANSIRGKSVM